MNIYFDKINKSRIERGISVKGFAKLLDVSRTTLWKWENAQLTPSEDVVKKIANILNVSINDISDIPEPVQVSQHKFSEVVDSWLGLTEINDKSHQNQIGLVLDTIQNLNNKLNQSVLIIKALLDSMETMFYIKDSRLKFLTANAAFLNNVSYDLGNPVLGKDDFIFFSQKEARVNTEEDRKVFQTGESILREERLIPGCRKTKWGIVSKLPVFDSENKIVGVIGTFIDITERKKSEEIRELLQKSIEDISLGLTIYDAELDKFVYNNKPAEMLLKESGYPKKMYGGNERDFFMNTFLHPDDKHLHISPKEWDKSKGFRYRVVNENGKIRWMEAFDSEIKINNRGGVLGIFRDVTDKVKSEEKLNLIEKCLDSTGHVISITDDQNREYIYFSKDSFEFLSGYSLDDVSQKGNVESFLSLICHPDDLHKHYYSVKWPEIHKLKWRMICANKEIKWIETTVSQIYNDQTKLFYTIGSSIPIENKPITTSSINNELLQLSPNIIWTANIKSEKNFKFFDSVIIEENIKTIENYLIDNNETTSVFDETTRRHPFNSEKAFRKIYGSTIIDIKNRSFTEDLQKIWHQDDVSKLHYNEDWPKLHTDIMRTNSRYNKSKWIFDIKTRIYDKTKRVFYSVSWSKDITDEYKVGNHPDIKETTKYFIDKIIPIFCYTKNIKTMKLEHLSDEIEILTGYSKLDFIEERTKPQLLIHSDYHEEFNSWLENPKTPIDFNFKIITSENKTVDMKTSVLSKETEDGETLYYGKSEII